MKLAVPDMISNSYFPAIAAIELGCFAQEGLDVSLRCRPPAPDRGRDRDDDAALGVDEHAQGPRAR